MLVNTFFLWPSLFVEQSFDLLQKPGQLTLQDIPDDAVVDLRVGVDQDVAKRDDPLVLTDSCGSC